MLDDKAAENNIHDDEYNTITHEDNENLIRIQSQLQQFIYNEIDRNVCPAVIARSFINAAAGTGAILIAADKDDSGIDNTENFIPKFIEQFEQYLRLVLGTLEKDEMSKAH